MKGYGLMVLHSTSTSFTLDREDKRYMEGVMACVE